MAGKNFCELCGEAGLSSRLVPHQVNTEEAIFICANSECVFPLGSPNVGSFVISRKAAEISNPKRKRKKTLSKNNPEKSLPQKTSSSTPEQFLNWENVDALCWLDSALSLLVHNKTLKTIISTIKSSDSLLRTLLDGYSKAQQLVSTDLTTAKRVLADIRQETWTYLAPKMKCSLGVNDSPIFALPLLFKENGVTLENCVQEYTWEFNCDSCGFAEKTRQKKYLVTYPNTPKDFDFEKASFVRTCPSCKSTGQRSSIVHKKMPDVVLMHFVDGLLQDCFDSKFVFNNYSYQLTQFLQYTRNPDHFICWTKENYGTRWLELDDLKPAICSWSSCSPTVPPSEVHVVVFEKITSESPEKIISIENNTSAQKIKDTDEVIISSTEISRNKEIIVSKIDLCHPQRDEEESLANNMDTVKVQESVEAKETSDLGTKLIASNLKEKMILNESLSPASVTGTHVSNTPGRFPLKDCSNTPDTLSLHGKTVTAVHLTLPKPTSSRPEKTLCNASSMHSYPSPSLGNSLISVTLKKYSYSKKFQPSLNNKRRAFSPQFQPYVPKKQRLESHVHNKPSLLDFDNQSDSGYSSPSSVSSCGSVTSTTSTETDQKTSVNDDMEKMDIDDSHHDDIAEELEKLLPDCLLDNCRKRVPVDEEQFCSQTLKLESLSQEQDDFIRNLLFDE